MTSRSGLGGVVLSAVSIIAQGPTGIGYFCDVADMPWEDRGLTARRHGALLVCDAAIVASICAREFPGRVHLVTNHLGSVECESQLLRDKLEPAVRIYQDPAAFAGAPIDLVLVDRARGTRSFVTTNYHPSSTHLIATTRHVRSSVMPARDRVVAYVDIELASDGGRAALQASPGLADSDWSVWNVGQVPRLSDAEAWLCGSSLPENAIIQISLGNAELSKQELRWAYRQVTTSPGQTLLVTLGSNGAVWANDRDTEAIAVDPVANPFTLGAGAVLASSLVTALADSESPTIGAVIAEAVAQATRYVQDASAGGEMLGLRLW
jgi:hypothetical protein